MVKSEIKSAEVYAEIELKHLPEGKYEGVWGGNIVNLVIDGFQYRLVAVNGIRTPSAKCTVLIEGGKVTVETI